LDEGFESITLVQTVKTEPKPIILCDEPGGTYWRQWLRYVKDQLLTTGMIDDTDLDVFYITDRAEDAVVEIMRFYRRYHSSRFVGDRLVIRLNSPLSGATLAEINRSFADILVEGRIEQVDGPLEEENGACPGQPRLVLSFDRRSAGRLRGLINRMNQE
jgi:hypothetical protein